jgi:hypothetical protein
VKLRRASFALALCEIRFPTKVGLPDEASALLKVRLRQDFGGQTSPLSKALFLGIGYLFHFRLACQTKPRRSLVEAGGVEPPSESNPLKHLHT